MKKQIEIVTKMPVRPRSTSKLWILIAGIVTIFYRNLSNRNATPGVPPNTWGFAKQTVFSIMSDVENHVSGEQFTSCEWIAAAGLIITLIVFIVIIAKKLA